MMNSDKAIYYQWAVVLLLALGVAAGCRATPPSEEDPTPAEAPQEPPTSQEESPDEEEPVEEEPDSRERDDEDDGADDEADPAEVAPHVERRLIEALETAEGGDDQRAIDDLVELVDEPEGGFMAAYNVGVLYDRRGDMRQAAEYYAQALQKQPDFTPALKNLIRLYLRVGETAEAEEVASTFVEQRPENLEHRAAALDVALAEGRYEDAIAGARAILRRDVEHVDAMIQLARAMYHLGRYELAGAIIRGRAMALAPERGELHYILGQIAWDTGRLEDAQEHFSQAIELQPRFPEARTNYALLLINAGNYSRAIDQLESALDDAPMYGNAWLVLGNAYKADGQYGEAEQAYQEAVSHESSEAQAQYNLGLLYLEADVPGYEVIERNELAIEALNAYRQAVGERQSSEDSVGDYVNEATANIEAEEQRLEARRQLQAAQQGADDEADDDESGDEGGEGDDTSNPNTEPETQQ